MLRRATRTDAVRCMQLAQDETADGRPLRLLMVAEDHTRDLLAIEVRQRMRFRHLIAMDDELAAMRLAPVPLLVGNEPEMTLKAVEEWCAASGTVALCTDPSLGQLDGFNSQRRDVQSSAEIGTTLAEARLLVDRWRLHYNHRPIQRTLDKLTPCHLLRHAWRFRRCRSRRTPALRHRQALMVQLP